MKLLATLLLLFVPLVTFSQETIHYTIYHNGAPMSFFNALGTPPPPMVQGIASRIFRKPFNPEQIRDEYYHVTINSDILWQGRNIVQYDYSPIYNDRFRHVLWVLPEDSKIVKLEIHDTEDRMLYSAIYLELNPLQEDAAAKQRNRPQRDEYRGRGRNKGNTNNINYAGFSLVFTERMSNGDVRSSYSDGLNRFSVFKAPAELQKDTDPEKVIVYGNYVYNKDKDGFRYTVVGTVPFDKMEQMIHNLGN